jgi:signal transduction histidine kinase
MAGSNYHVPRNETGVHVPRLLVVEDEPIAALGLRKQLQSLGYEVAAQVASGEQAIQSAGELKPDLVLMDIALAGAMDGVQAAEEIRRRFQLPVVYLTAHAHREILERAKLTEPFGYLIKPHQERDLHITIEMALYKHRMEQQHRQISRMEAVGRLAGGIAHDFNNLLTVINGYSSLLLAHLPDHDSTREMVRQIHQAGERAAALTKQLLAYSRKQMLQPRELALEQVLTGLEPNLRRLLGANIELALVLAGQPCRVKVDPNQLEQVILELAANARDAMPAGGRLTLETRYIERDEVGGEEVIEGKAGPWVVLSVSDTGCGMERAVLAHIFEPYYTTKAQGKGTGLGLAAVYGTVQQSGGQVRVESEAGRGSTFRIYLAALSEPRPRAQPQPGNDLPGGTETILLVETGDDVRTVAVAALEQAGYQVLPASQEVEALEISARHPGPIHLLITELSTPWMDGRQLAAALRILHPRLGVLYLSRSAEELIRDAAGLESGAALLAKPFTLRDLGAKVRTLLESADRTPSGSVQPSETAP